MTASCSAVTAVKPLRSDRIEDTGVVTVRTQTTLSFPAPWKNAGPSNLRILPRTLFLCPLLHLHHPPRPVPGHTPLYIAHMFLLPGSLRRTSRPTSGYLSLCASITSRRTVIVYLICVPAKTGSNIQEGWRSCSLFHLSHNRCFMNTC